MYGKLVYPRRKRVRGGRAACGETGRRTFSIRVRNQKVTFRHKFKKWRACRVTVTIRSTFRIHNHRARFPTTTLQYRITTNNNNHSTSHNLISPLDHRRNFFHLRTMPLPFHLPYPRSHLETSLPNCFPSNQRVHLLYQENTATLHLRCHLYLAKYLQQGEVQPRPPT